MGVFLFFRKTLSHINITEYFEGTYTVRESIFVKIRLISRISRILVDFAKISSFENYWKYWTYWQNFSFVPDSPSPLSDTLLLWSIWTYTVRESIFMKIRFREFWSILRKLVPSKIIGNIWHIRKIFPHLLSDPSTMLCHLDPFWTYWQNFWFFSRPLPPSVTDSFWMYWQNISFFLQLLPHSVTLIHFGYIGKTSYFSLSPLPLPSFETHPFWIYWQHIFIFPSPPTQPLLCSVTYW